MKQLHLILLASATLFAGCGSGGGGGGGTTAFDDGVPGYTRTLPCGTFKVTDVADTPGVKQCILVSGNQSEIVQFCSIESECQAACEDAAASCQ